MNKPMPKILRDVQTLRTAWKSEKWLREKFCKSKKREQRIKFADDMLKKVDAIDSWCRARLTEEEWKGIIE